MESEDGVWDAFAYWRVNLIKTFNDRRSSASSSEKIIPTLKSGCEMQRKWV